MPKPKGNIKFTQTRKWKPGLPSGFEHGMVEKVIQVSVNMVSRATSTAIPPAPLHMQILVAIKLQNMWKKNRRLQCHNCEPARGQRCDCCGNTAEDVGILSVRGDMHFCQYCVDGQ